jgi:hypothetical protein
MASEGMIEHIQRQEAVELDEFGNAQLSGSHALSDYLTQLVKTNIKSTASLRCHADTYGYFLCMPQETLINRLWVWFPWPMFPETPNTCQTACTPNLV